MSEKAIMGVEYPNIRVDNARVYDLEESIAASKYPMQIQPDKSNTELSQTAVKLAQCGIGEGHDNWLCGVRVAFDITMTAKCLIEAERYNFWDIVSCNSTMHRITRFDLSKAYSPYVDPRIVTIMKTLVNEYGADPTPGNYLRLLYSNPAGFLYTMRVDTNYRQLKTIYKQRLTHRLPEWREFCAWIKDELPHSELIVGTM